ncbi:MAG: alginate lyase family protein [Calditrichaeota bacterium]|nr:alginate lyase family protein [Calditrichota bacterium]
MFKASLNLFLLLMFFNLLGAKDNPCLLINESEADEIRQSISEYPIFIKSFNNTKAKLDKTLAENIVVPPPGEAGGYEHEKHKQNYRDMQSAGMIFQLTKDEKYALFVKQMLYKYAELYPTLGPHPLSHKQAPGKLFHQMLNEAVWLVYTAQAYDCIYNWLSPEERQHIEKNVFKYIVEWFTEVYPGQLDRIHNHGMWIAASIGMLGYVLDDDNLVEMALFGTKKDGKGGFLKQLDLLFSPDGYYLEGPYYIRYALRPLFLFAEAVERNQPEIKIFEHRNGIIGKALFSSLQTVFPNGNFPPINDASRSMNVKSIGPVIANNIAYHRFGANPNLLAIAQIQNQVILNKAGFVIAKDLAEAKDSPQLNWQSVEFSDGYDGKQGGLGILRHGSGQDQTMLLMKYGSHGLGHGHFDKLHFSYFNQGSEVIFDYGFARWVNIEPKFGGRYLPENDSYAKQTIAHNTVTVDQKTQNNANRKTADKVSAERHFFHSTPEVKVMSAKATKQYDGISMQRTMFLLEDSNFKQPLVLDLFKIKSQSEHEYDYPIHYHGQIIATNLEYDAAIKKQRPLGDDFGYQHIWDNGGGKTNKPLRFTWLNENRYYSLIGVSDDEMVVKFGRTGANDPKFNLRSEPLLVLRKKAKDHLFASVIEAHGYYSEASEKSVQASPRVNEVKIIGSNDKATVVEIAGKNFQWQVMVTNEEASDFEKHKVEFQNQIYEWTGNFKIIKN